MMKFLNAGAGCRRVARRWLGAVAAVVLMPGWALAQDSVNLGTAMDFAILAGTGITNTGATTIIGDVGSFPDPSISGFNTVVLTGVNHGGDAVTQQAKTDLIAAYSDAVARIPTTTFGAAADLGGLTLAAGVYNGPTSLALTGNLTLDGMGDPNAVWIFQMGSTLVTAAGSTVTLTNGAQACHVFWQVGSSATLGVGSEFAGTIMAFASITSNTGVMLDGRLLALNGAVTLDANNIELSLCEIVVDGDEVIVAPTVVAAVTLDECSQLQLLSTLTINSGNVTVPNGQALISGGTVVVPGNFNKNGAGTLVTDTLIQVGNTASINQGALIVNGTLEASQVNVRAGTQLGGNGRIVGNVSNSGILGTGNLEGCFVGPGNEIGTLQIDGNYTQSANGTLQVELGSTTSFDQLVISGNANLSGVLDLIPLGGFTLEFGQQFQNFLVADSITGMFDSILLPDGFRARIVQDGGSLTIIIAPESYTQVAQTPNQQQVAGALDSFIPATSGDQETVSAALDELTSEEYQDAFNAISPAFYQTLGIIAIEQTNAQNQFLSQRFNASRLGNTRGFRSEGIEMPLVNDKDGKSVVSAKDGKYFQAQESSIMSNDPANKWGVWVLGNGTFGRLSNVSQVPNSNFQSGGVLTGIDYAWNEHFTTGLFGGYQGLYSKYNNGGSAKINSAIFGGYVSYQNGGFYTDAIVSGGVSNNQVRRPIQFGSIDRTARSSPDGGQFSAYLGLGYDWQIGNFTFGPILGGQYIYAQIGSFTESGADSLDLQVGQQSINSFRSSVGGHIAYTWNITRNIALIPEIRMLWQHEYGENSRNINSSLDGGDGPSFNYQTNNPDRDSVFAGAGVIAQFGQRWNAFCYYNADFGRQDYLAHMVSVGAGYKF